MTENPGGVESFLMNYYRNIDRNVLQFDFLCNTHRRIAYEEEILSLGGKVYHITARSENMAKYRKEMKRFFSGSKDNYLAIWVNVSSLANIDYLVMAKRYGIRRRIIHSHNAANMDSFLRGLLHRFNKNLISRYATDFWACSPEAEQWFYNRKLQGKVRLVKNAIPAEQYSFSAEARERIRTELGWNDCFVIGSVGRLHFQKNQMFMLEILRCLQSDGGPYRLVLVGDGEDKNKLRERIREYGLTGFVWMAGVQKKIRDWLSAFDLLLFPSVFEGASVTLLEAQANGIPVLASENVCPDEMVLNENVFRESLGKPAKTWAERIKTLQSTEPKRELNEMVEKRFGEKGYSIRREAEKLTKEFTKDPKEKDVQRR